MKEQQTAYSYNRNRSLPKIKVLQTQENSFVANIFRPLKLKYNASISTIDKKLNTQVQEITSQTNNLNGTNKLHTVQETIYQIHKAALTKYLDGHSLDPRLKSMNLLKASQMNDDEIQTLQRAFFDDKVDVNLQEKLQKVLNQFKVKSKNNRQRYMKYFKSSVSDSNDEVDIQQITTALKDILDHKLKCQKLFNGTYLVDPTSEDLQHQLIHNHKIAVKTDENEMKNFTMVLGLEKVHLPPIQKVHPKLNYEGLTGNSVVGIISEQQSMITQLKDRFSRKILSPNAQSFISSLQKKDYAEIQYQMQGAKGRQLIHTIDENGQYPVHIAVQLGDPEMLKILLNNGANKHIKNLQGKTAKQLSEIYINDDINFLLT